MKKLSYLLIIFCPLLLLSCQKNAEPDNAPMGDSTKVTFIVNGFSKEMTDIKNNSLKVNETSTNLIGTSYISMLIYNENGTLRVQRTKNAGTYPYGDNKFIEGLPKGKYTIVFVGITDTKSNTRGIAFQNPSQLNSTTNTFYITDVNTNNNVSTEPNAYYKKIQLDVTGNDFSQTVTIERLYSKMEFTIKDAIPQNAKTITIQVEDNLPYKTYLSTGMLQPLQDASAPYITYYKTVQLADSVKGTNNFQISGFFTADSTKQYDISISASQQGQLLSKKTILNVTFKRNKIVSFSGNLFGGNGTSNSTTINIDPTWSSDVIEKQF